MEQAVHHVYERTTLDCFRFCTGLPFRWWVSATVLHEWRMDGEVVAFSNRVANTGLNSIALASASYSLSAWIRPTAFLEPIPDLLKVTGGLQTIIGNGAQANNGYYHEGLAGFWMALNGKRLVYLMSDNESANVSKGRAITKGATDIAPDEWTHIAVIVDRADHSVKLFVNGVLESGAGDCSIIKTQTSQVPLIIGARTANGDCPFLGDITSVQLFSQALTLQQVQVLAAPTSLPDG